MKKILVVVDMQNDFLTGTLANESAVKIIPNIQKEITSGIYDCIIFTRDTHNSDYLSTQEGKKLPVPHCLKGSKGWNVCDELTNVLSENQFVSYLDKPTFGYDEWDIFCYHYLDGIVDEQTDVEFTFTGTCTDICVVSNALAVKATFPEASVRCLANCCAPLMGSETKQESALQVMESCQVEVIR